MVKTYLTYWQRSLVAKLLCRILPLELETGRYQDVDENDRTYRVCGTEAVENEIHFIFCCPGLRERRRGIKLMSDQLKLRGPFVRRLNIILSESNMKRFAEALETLFNARQHILYG